MRNGLHGSHSCSDGIRSFLVENSKHAVAPIGAPAENDTSNTKIIAMLAIGGTAALMIYLSTLFLSRLPSEPTRPRLKMGGTSAVAVILQNRWKAHYRETKGIDIDYDSTGSTTGVTRLLDGAYTIAFTHAALSDEQRQKARQKGSEFVQIPVLLCGVAVVYNVAELKGKEPLKINGEVLADIFLGKIDKWNDDALQALNPGSTLPPTPITVVHREDSSGTTLIFTEYLATVSQLWRDQVGPADSEIKWPVGVASPRNIGVAKRVDQIEGAIGYVDRLFTSYEDIHLDFAAVQNKDQTGFVRAEPQNMTAAATGILAEIPEDLTFRLANQPGDNAYPISGVIYAVCSATQPEVNRKLVIDFLRWATHDGQDFAAKMDYAPLPPELVERVERRLEAIK
jgi:phosphate transport system substrate-binding protein